MPTIPINTNERNSKAARALRDAWRLVYNIALKTPIRRDWTPDAVSFLSDVCPLCGVADHGLTACPAEGCGPAHDDAHARIEDCRMGGVLWSDLEEDVRDLLGCDVCAVLAVWPKLDAVTAGALIRGSVYDVSGMEVDAADGRRVYRLDGAVANAVIRSADRWRTDGFDVFDLNHGQRVRSIGQDTEDGSVYAATDYRFQAQAGPGGSVQSTASDGLVFVCGVPAGRQIRCLAVW